MVGEPVVRGTRIPVETVLGKLTENPDVSELFAAATVSQQDFDAELATR